MIDETVPNDCVVSIIIPCRNERRHIAACIESVVSNGFPGKLEVIVVDGMSDDGTRDVLERLAATYTEIVILDNPARTTPVGMNIGAKFAHGDYLLFLGAHCSLGKGYIQTMVSKLRSGTRIGCAGGQTVSVPSGGPWAAAIAAARQSKFGVGNSLYRFPLKDEREVDTVAYGVYPKAVIEEVGVFDERLLRNQDIELNHRVRSAGYTIVLTPSAHVYYTPRSSLRSFARQNYLNGWWGIRTWLLKPGALSLRHFVPMLFVSTLILLLLFSLISTGARWLLTAAIITYVGLSLFEALRIAFSRRNAAALLVSLVFPVLHVSYGFGSIVSVFTHLGTHILERRI